VGRRHGSRLKYSQGFLEEATAFSTQAGLHARSTECANATDSLMGVQLVQATFQNYRCSVVRTL